MTANKPTLVIIPGAFHTPESYDRLTTALRSQGYEVHVPRLPTTNGARPPNAGLADDTALVRGCVQGLVLAGRTVVVIGHSYGGQVMSNALCGLGSGVSALVYMAGYALPEGKSTLDAAREAAQLGSGAAELVLDAAPDGTMVLCDAPSSMGLVPRREGKQGGTQDGEDEDEDVEAYVATLCRWNGAAMTEPLASAAWREVPAVAYVHATADLSVPLAAQQAMVRAIGGGGLQGARLHGRVGALPSLYGHAGRRGRHQRGRCWVKAFVSALGAPIWLGPPWGSQCEWFGHPKAAEF